MIKNQAAVLQSKLAVYKVCYREAQRTDDIKRILALGTIIEDLKDEIALL